jgi:hypothetical protein
MMKNFYKELPVGYKEIKVIDAKDVKTIVIMNIVAVLLYIASILPFFLLRPLNLSFENLKELQIALIVLMFGMLIYIILHELVHGFWYKVLTKEKLTFGLTLTVAFCGVPNIYVSKKTALFAITGPFILFSVILLPILIIMPTNLIYCALVMIFGLHISGCVGDLYGMFYLLSQKGNILMNDTGPKQTFYKLDE